MRAIVFALLLVGCDCGSPSSPPTEPNEPTAEATPEPTPGEEPALTPSPEAPEVERPPPLSAQDRATVRAAVREGREATRIGDTARAVERFDEAIAINPHDPTLHCEAGFAALELESQRDYARRQLGTGIALFGDAPRDADRLGLAMCLYNRGLLAEREEDWPTAVRSFERSLALREHAAARANLQSARRQEVPQSGLIVAEDAAALVESMREDGWTTELSEQWEAEGSRPELALVCTVEESDVEWGYDSWCYLAIRTRGGWDTTRVWGGTAPPCCGYFDNFSVEDPRSVGGAVLVRVEAETRSYSDQELEPEEDDEPYCSCSEGFSTSSSAALLCRFEQERLTCRRFHLARVENEELTVECSDDENDHVAPPAWAREGCRREPYREAWSYALEVDAARGIRLRVDEGDPPVDPEWPVGRWLSVDDIFDLADP